MTTILDLTTTTIGTGIIGDMTSTGSGTLGSSAIQTSTGGIIILGILFLAGVIAHLLDRRLSLRQDQE